MSRKLKKNVKEGNRTKILYDYNKKNKVHQEETRAIFITKARMIGLKPIPKTISEILSTYMQWKCKCNKEDNQKK